MFFMETEIAVGEYAELEPALAEAPTTDTLALVVALFTRLYTEALTMPPTPRTAATMMKRSILWEIAGLFRLIFIVPTVELT